MLDDTANGIIVTEKKQRPANVLIVVRLKWHVLFVHCDPHEPRLERWSKFCRLADKIVRVP